MSKFDDTFKEYYADLRKLQNEYNYDSRSCGSIEINDVGEDGRRVAAVNWSCAGSLTPKYARPFAEALVLSDGIGNLSVFNASTAYVATVFAQYVTISTTPKVTTTSANTSVTLKCVQC